MPCSRKSYLPNRASPYPTRNQCRIESTRKQLCAAQNAYGDNGGLPEPTFHRDGIDCLRDKATRDDYHAWRANVRRTYGSYVKYNARRWPVFFYQAVYAEWKEDQQIVKNRDASDADKAAELAELDAYYRATLEDHPWLGTSVEDDPGATYGSETEQH